MSDTDNKAIDVEVMRAEIKAAREQSKQDLTQALEENVARIMANVEQAISSSKGKSSDNENPKTTSGSGFNIAEFHEEMEEIGINQNQANGFLRMVEKVIERKGGQLRGELKDEILSTVDTNLTLKEQKLLATQEMRKLYPSIAEKGSDLFKEAQKFYANMSKTMRADPEAEAICVERAANRLGIRPVNLSDVLAQDASNPTGEGGGSGKKPKKPELSADLAAFFRVDADKVNAAFK